MIRRLVALTLLATCVLAIPATAWAWPQGYRTEISISPGGHFTAVLHSPIAQDLYVWMRPPHFGVPENSPRWEYLAVHCSGSTACHLSGTYTVDCTKVFIQFQAFKGPVWPDRHETFAVAESLC